MSHLIRLHRSSRRLLLAAVALSLVMGLLSAGPAAAHNFTTTDGNDSPGRLDIRTASVGHKNNSVVHTVRTFEGWTPRSLGNDSYLIVLIDKNFDSDFEQCAFIFFASGRLRGSLTNCRRTFIRQLPVSKPSKALARVTIPTGITSRAYRWVVFSYWSGLPARCSDLCFDAAPNRPPPILHDLKPPSVSMTTSVLNAWVGSTTNSFRFPFTISDEHSGISSWTIQEHGLDPAGAWTTVLSGQVGGARNPLISKPEGTQVRMRVVAVDKHSNMKIGPERLVLVPLDDDNLGTAGVFSGGTVTPNTDAFGESYTALALDESFTYTYEHPGGPCRRLALIGPGTGDWVVHLIHDSTGQFLSHDMFPDEPRQTLYSGLVCQASTVFVEVDSGSGFAVDALAA